MDSWGILLMIAVIILMVWALMDLWKSKKKQDFKILFTVLIILLPIIGSIVWLIVRHSK